MSERCRANHNGPHRLTEVSRIAARTGAVVRYCACGATWDPLEFTWSPPRSLNDRAPEGGDDGSRFFGGGGA